MKKKFCFGLALTAMSVSASTLPFTETFDELTNNVSINNQNGWVLDNGTNATVQSSVVATNSSQALKIQNSQVSHSLSSTGTSVWVSFQARITAAPDTDPVMPVNASAAFFINTNRYLVVWDGTNPVVLSEQILLDAWTRFDIYCNYDTQKWSLNVNGTNAANNIGFFSAAQQIKSLKIASDSLEPAYIDSVSVIDKNAAALPFLETFEPTNHIAPGSIDGQNGWVVKSGDAIVQSDVVKSGSQALHLQNAQVSHDLLSANGSDEWAQFQVFCSGAQSAIPVQIDTNVNFAFLIDTAQHLVVYSNSIPIVLNTQIPTNTWTRFDVYCDYENMDWCISVNGTNVASGLRLSSNSRLARSCSVSGNGYMDQINVSDEEQPSVTGDIDFNKNGIPDWWEQRYFGGITNAASDGIASNGMSNLEAYIAGLNPADANARLSLDRRGARRFSWIRQPGRQYDIYWTTNLISGLTLIYPDIPDSDFEDTNTVRTTEAAGFYQIRVHK